jgi:hypothetical protein
MGRSFRSLFGRWLAAWWNLWIGLALVGLAGQAGLAAQRKLVEGLDDTAWLVGPEGFGWELGERGIHLDPNALQRDPEHCLPAVL